MQADPIAGTDAMRDENASEAGGETVKFGVAQRAPEAVDGRRCACSRAMRSNRAIKVGSITQLPASSCRQQRPERERDSQQPREHTVQEEKHGGRGEQRERPALAGGDDEVAEDREPGRRRRTPGPDANDEREQPAEDAAAAVIAGGGHDWPARDVNSIAITHTIVTAATARGKIDDRPA